MGHTIGGRKTPDFSTETTYSFKSLLMGKEQKNTVFHDPKRDSLTENNPWKESEKLKQASPHKGSFFLCFSINPGLRRRRVSGL